jgi:hypothetical protein
LSFLLVPFHILIEVLMEDSRTSVRAIDAMLDRMVDSRVITPEGRQWLVAALDPFHDTDVDCSGYPDINVAPCVVQLVKVSTQISKPAAVSSGTWDCNLVLLPWFTSTELGSVTLTGNFMTVLVTPITDVGGVLVLSGATGTSLDLTDNVESSLSISDSYFKGASRVIRRVLRW